MGGVGRLMKTTSAFEATSSAEAATSAPRAASGAVAAGLVSKTTSEWPGVEQPGGHRSAHASDADETERYIAHAIVGSWSLSLVVGGSQCLTAE